MAEVFDELEDFVGGLPALVAVADFADEGLPVVGGGGEGFPASEVAGVALPADAVAAVEADADFVFGVGLFVLPAYIFSHGGDYSGLEGGGEWFFVVRFSTVWKSFWRIFHAMEKSFPWCGKWDGAGGCLRWQM